jgi:cobalt/nickel transport system permease protein
VVALLTQGPLYEIALAGKSLGAPKKLVNLILLSSRYFHVIFAEYQRLRLAMRARGFNSNFSRHTFLSLSNLMGMLLVRSWDRADRIHKAMLARGYDGDLHASSNFHFSQADVLFSLAIILVTIILLVFEWFPTI